MESQTEILVLTNFTSLVIFNYLPPCLSFWLSFLLLKCMPVIIFLYQLHLWFTYSFKVILHLILYCIHMDLKHIILFKENKKLFKAIKTPTKISYNKILKHYHLVYTAGRLEQTCIGGHNFFSFSFATWLSYNQPLTFGHYQRDNLTPFTPPCSPSSSNVNCCFITIYNSTWRSSKAS